METPITGSRLGKRDTDRTVRGVNNDTVKQDVQVRGLANEIGARSN